MSQSTPVHATEVRPRDKSHAPGSPSCWVLCSFLLRRMLSYWCWFVFGIVCNGESAKSTPRLERRQSIPTTEPLGTMRTTVSSYPQYFSFNVCSLALYSWETDTMIDVAYILQVIHGFQIVEPPLYHRCLIFWKPDFTLRDFQDKRLSQVSSSPPPQVRADRVRYRALKEMCWLCGTVP